MEWWESRLGMMILLRGIVKLLSEPPGQAHLDYAVKICSR